jgi:lysozyme family protein
MAIFDTAVSLVLKHEGGFVDNPLDPGGPTNMGVTQNVYSRYLGRPATAADVKAMPVEHAKDIFKKWYWALVGADSIRDQNVANWVMDMAVLRGVQAAAKAVQTVLGVTTDGAIGPKTLAALNGYNPDAFLLQFYKLCVSAFIGIVQQKSNQMVFLPQWTRRAGEILDTVTKLLKG